MFLKICGMTTRDAVDAAVAAGVDAVGFVFAPSKRQVTASRAAELAAGVPSSVLRVAVMRHPAQSLLDEVWSLFRPDVLQTDHEDLETLRISRDLEILPVVRAGGQVPLPLPPRLLFEGPVSGAGKTTDWTQAQKLARQTRLILAGGLAPENVAAAIGKVRPFGVDVSSGVESAPGVKDPARIAAFVAAVRKASQTDSSLS